MARNNSKRTSSKNANHPLGVRVFRRNNRFREFMREHNEMVKQQRQLKGGEKHVK